MSYEEISGVPGVEGGSGEEVGSVSGAEGGSEEKVGGASGEGVGSGQGSEGGLGEAVANYLEQLFENVSQIRKQAYLTLGMFCQERVNHCETLFIP